MCYHDVSPEHMVPSNQGLSLLKPCGKSKSFFLQVIYGRYLGCSVFAQSKNYVFRIGLDARELRECLRTYAILLYLISKFSQVPNSTLANRIISVYMAKIDQSKICLSIISIFPEELPNQDPVSPHHLEHFISS